MTKAKKPAPGQPQRMVKIAGQTVIEGSRLHKELLAKQAKSAGVGPAVAAAMGKGEPQTIEEYRAALAEANSRRSYWCQQAERADARARRLEATVEALGDALVRVLGARDEIPF